MFLVAVVTSVVGVCRGAGASAHVAVPPTAGPVVVTSDGPVEGGSSQGVNFFRGIPFAAAPLGPLRWKPPQRPTPWTTPFQASNWGSHCIQSSGIGSEDCLFVNVHTSANATPSSKLPVLLWIHGGGYQDGNGDVDGTQLVKQLAGKAIVASSNYRLNVYGFLGGEALRSRDPANSTGNYGIQDQRAAMLWVQKNIAAFGGDPTRVTIFGCSAGGGSMTNHISMPKSNGAFTSAIIESGSFSAWTAKPAIEANAVYEQVLNGTGCTDVACIQAVDPATLSAAVKTIPAGSCCSHLQGTPWLPWSPVVDGVELMAHPWILAKEGRVNKVPVMQGTCQDEGAGFESQPMSLTQTVLDQLWTQWYAGGMGPTAPTLLNAAYRNQSYPSNTPTFTATTAWWEAQRALSDQDFICPAFYTSTYLSASAGLDVYQYMFSGSATVAIPTAVHCSNMAYQFQQLPESASQEEWDLAHAIGSYIFNFAATGNPNTAPSPTLLHNGNVDGETLPRWPRYTETDDRQYLILDTATRGGIRAVVSGKAKECAFMEAWIQHFM